ncbi:MAG TPA: hypothetical protein VI259_13500 [Gemmatimonadaceae bacterium]
MRRRIVCAVLALLPLAAFADKSPVDVSWVETKDLRLYFYDPLEYLVPHAVRTFTNSLEWQRRMFGWTPSERTKIYLEDRGDYGNALSIVAPQLLVFDVAPLPLAFESWTSSERIYALMNHEMVHVTQSDIASEEDRRWRRFFGGKISPATRYPETLLYSYLTIPRYTTPRWYSEGGAVFAETWMSGGLGRAQGGYDEMVFRAMVRDDAHFYDPLGLVSRGVKVDFQVVANAYLYGTRFFTWLAYKYSPEKALAWIRRDEGSERYYADRFQQVFGTTLDAAWQEWIAFEHEFQRRNLAELRKYPITPYHALVQQAVGSMSRTYYDEATNEILAAFTYPGVVPHVGALSLRDGNIRRLADVKGAVLYKVASFAYDPATSTAFYTDDNYEWRTLMSVNVKTGEERTLLEHARIGEIVFNPVDRSLMGVRHSNGLATLVRIPFPYDHWDVVASFDYGFVPYDLDISSDGRMLSASVSEVNGDQYLRVWDLAKLLVGDVRPISEFRFGESIPESAVFSKDGRYLYGSSYYTGVSNIFRYEVATGKVDVVSNAETGFFRPMPLADGRLLVLVYTANGFVPATIEPRPLTDVSAIKFLGAELVEKYPEIKSWQVAPPSTVDEEKLVTNHGPYYPLRSIKFANAFPVLQGYKNAIGLGYHANFLDPLQFASLGMTAAYTPSGVPGNERAHFDITANYLDWRSSLAWNRSDFYDLFGPTKRSRKGLAAKLGYDQYLIRDEPKIFKVSYDVEYYDHIDTLPNAQNVESGFTRLTVAQVGLHYADPKRSLGSVDDEKGIVWDIVAKGNHVSGATPVQLRGDFDFGIPLALPHSSIWLRSGAGISSGNRDNSIANFYFGAFGNNYVDSGEIKRYRDYYAMPGFGIDEISGQSYVREMVEWNLPPMVFESAGTPGMYLNWLRPAMFVAGLWTDPNDSAFRKDYQSVGAQADLRFSVLHRYDMTLSVGYAVGFRGGRRSGDEVMVSLKIL